MNTVSLDNHITGHWGEDSLPDEPSYQIAHSQYNTSLYESKDGERLIIASFSRYGQFANVRGDAIISRNRDAGQRRRQHYYAHLKPAALNRLDRVFRSMFTAAPAVAS